MLPEPRRSSWVRQLLRWFRTHGESYPFRFTSDPYKILISEVLLRQTTARQVSKVYNEFFAKYPTPAMLSRAGVRELSKILRPLGIRSRPRTVMRIGEVLVSKYSGEVPRTLDDLKTIEGVGDYTAACVLTFGYGLTTPMLDVNSIRVLSRIYGLGKGSRSQKESWSIYGEILATPGTQFLHYAIIDLAHSICKPKGPFCTACPCRLSCEYAHRSQNQLRAPRGL
jgi:A/G-specific adenine glycosylase